MFECASVRVAKTLGYKDLGSKDDGIKGEIASLVKSICKNTRDDRVVEGSMAVLVPERAQRPQTLGY